VCGKNTVSPCGLCGVGLRMLAYELNHWTPAPNYAGRTVGSPHTQCRFCVISRDYCCMLQYAFSYIHYSIINMKGTYIMVEE